MAYISLICDETGTGDNFPLVVIGGGIAHVDDWNRIAEPWNKVLSTYHVPFFHATDCAARRNEFAHLSETESNALFCELAEIVMKSVGIDYVGAEVDKKLFAGIVHKFPRVGVNIYQFLTQVIGGRVSEWGRAFPAIPEVNIYFATGQKIGTPHMKAIVGESVHKEFFYDGVRIVEWGTIDNNPYPVQYADLINWELRWFKMHGEQLPSSQRRLSYKLVSGKFGRKGCLAFATEELIRWHLSQCQEINAILKSRRKS